MKIVDLAAFRALHEGAIFQKYEPCTFGPMTIKGETLEHDFLVQYLDPQFDGVNCEDEDSVLDKIAAGEASPPMLFDAQGRDGFFDKDQLFAVWEPDDVRALIARLRLTLDGKEPADPTQTPQMDWQPIETAPKHGEYIVYDAFWGQIVVVGALPPLPDGKVLLIPVMGGHDPDGVNNATHWMPLPTPPEGDQ